MSDLDPEDRPSWGELPPEAFWHFMLTLHEGPPGGRCKTCYLPAQQTPCPVRRRIVQIMVDGQHLAASAAAEVIAGAGCPCSPPQVGEVLLS